MTEKEILQEAVNRLTAAICRDLKEAEANERAFSADLSRLIACGTSRYAIYRDQKFQASFDDFIDAMQYLLRTGGFPDSIHEVNTQAEPAILKREPPII